MATRKRSLSIAEVKAELKVYLAAPDAEEAYSDSIPAFRLDGRMLVWYPAWTEHTSVCPLNAAMRRAAGAALEHYELAEGTLRIPLGTKLPVALIKRVVKARASEIRTL